jgi:transcriptional regulator with XRE-family HTH domain
MARELTPLGELIQSRLDATGWSVRKLAQEAGISKTQVGNYMHGPMIDMPKTENIRRLAAALVLPERVVVSAALETVQLAHPSSGNRNLEDVIDEQAYLGVEDKDAFKAWVRAKRRGRGA